MNIKWNQVTWYSKLIAEIFFIGVVPAFIFYVGNQYEKIANSMLESYLATSVSSPHDKGTHKKRMNQEAMLNALSFSDADMYATAAYAKQFPTKDQQVACSDGQSLSQLDYNLCTGYRTHFYRARLESQYQQLSERYDADALTRISELWDQVAEQECRMIAEPFSGGSIYAAAFNECYESLLKSQIEALETIETGAPRG